MGKIHRQAGFTLVELAIVLTIVGLLIGGILKGQQLLQNSRVTATIAQINGFEAATTNFRDTYNELPGDLTDAQTRIQGCNAACDLSGIVGGLGTDVGNGKVGTINWNPATLYQSVPLAGIKPVLGTAPSNTVPEPIAAAETVLFWYELQQVGLISAVSDEGISTTGGSASFGGTLPAAKAGGGWLVGNISGLDYTGAVISSTLGRPSGDNLPPMGTVLVMTNDATAAAVSTGYTTVNKQALTPAVAAQIDRKIDDGIPNTGQVQAYGGGASAPTSPAINTCFGANTVITTGPWSYQEGKVSKDCGLILRIQR